MRLHVGAMLIVCTIVAACGGGSSNPSSPSSPPSSSPTLPTITIVGQNGTQAFTPNPAMFAGQMVVFRNNDSVTHRVVLNDNSGDTGDIAPGATSRVVIMPSAGTNYHCSVHPGMIGAVSGTAGDPPPCEGQYCTPY